MSQFESCGKATVLNISNEQHIKIKALKQINQHQANWREKAHQFLIKVCSFRTLKKLKTMV